MCWARLSVQGLGIPNTRVSRYLPLQLPCPRQTAASSIRRPRSAVGLSGGFNLPFHSRGCEVNCTMLGPCFKCLGSFPSAPESPPCDRPSPGGAVTLSGRHRESSISQKKKETLGCSLEGIHGELFRDVVNGLDALKSSRKPRK